MTNMTHQPHGRRALDAAATAWFLSAALGQLAFVAFILAYFGVRSLGEDLTALNQKPHLTGYVPGDTLGNSQFLLHVFIGALVTLAGVLQLLPAVRRRWPRVHRWSGRVFMASALVASFSGFWLTWVRGSQLGTASAVSTTLNGVLIVGFVVLAWRHALAADFARHRRAALRAWLLVNGVWFLRILMMLSGLGLAALGLGERYGQAAFLVVSFLSWTLPLAVLELYFLAERSSRAGVQRAMATLLWLLAVLTLAGSVAAAAFMWWPHL